MFDYNTDRKNLRIKGYGRNIQKMVDDAMKIEDFNERTKAANAIVRVMAQINIAANNKNENNNYILYSQKFWHKIWDHLYILSNYQLEIDSPFPKPEQESLLTPEISHFYNKSKIHLRTYGRNMQDIITKVSEYPENERNFWALPLANQLKKLYLFYNRNSVNDDLIINQLAQMSKGKIELPEGTVLNATRDILKQYNYYHNPKPAVKTSKSKRKKNKKMTL